MAEIGYGVPSTGSLLEAFSTIPSDYHGFFRDGFGRLAKLTREQWQKLISMLEEAAPYPSNIELGPILHAVGLERTSGSALVGAARLTLGVVSLRSESPKEFVEAALASKLILAADGAAITEFAELVANRRGDISKALAASTMQNSVLPSLSLFEVAVDLRLEFTDGKVSAASPVLVVHIDTDSVDQELWCQLSVPQLVALQAQLQKSLDELRSAQHIAKQLS